jgi:hypothetical protein
LNKERNNNNKKKVKFPPPTKTHHEPVSLSRLSKSIIQRFGTIRDGERERERAADDIVNLKGWAMI